MQTYQHYWLTYFLWQLCLVLLISNKSFCSSAWFMVSPHVKPDVTRFKPFLCWLYVSGSDATFVCDTICEQLSRILAKQPWWKIAGRWQNKLEKYTHIQITMGSVFGRKQANFKGKKSRGCRCPWKHRNRLFFVVTIWLTAMPCSDQSHPPPKKQKKTSL